MSSVRRMMQCAQHGWTPSPRPGEDDSYLLCPNPYITRLHFCIKLKYSWVLSYSFNKILQQKEELEQKHLHLLHIVESEKTSKWQLRQQCDELTTEISKLRTEVRSSHIRSPQLQSPFLRLVKQDGQVNRTKSLSDVARSVKQ